MLPLLYQAAYRFFTIFTVSLNKSEVDQPPPLEEQREHLRRQLIEVEKKLEAHRKLMADRDGKANVP